MCETEESLLQTLRDLGCLVLNSDFKSRDSFNANVAAILEDVQACKTFVAAFSSATHSEWIVYKNYANKHRYRHRIIYHCHFSKLNKSKPPSNTCESTRLQEESSPCDNTAPDPDAHLLQPKTKAVRNHQRNRHCTASIDITLQHVTIDTRKRHKHIKMGYDSLVKINFEHSHRTHVAEALSYRRMSASARECYTGYFNNGMTTAEAYSYHGLHLMNLYENDDDFNAVVADAGVNPSKRQVATVYSNWRKENPGERSHQSIIEALKVKQKTYAEKGIDVRIQENPLVITIITPIMKPAHAMAFSSEICFVDSSGSCDQSSPCITFMFGASKVGGVPLACVIHTSQSEEDYTQAFQSVKETLGCRGFFNKRAPTIFMTDNCEAVRNALRNAFGDTPTHLLCKFHLT